MTNLHVPIVYHAELIRSVRDIETFPEDVHEIWLEW